MKRKRKKEIVKCSETFGNFDFENEIERYILQDIREFEKLMSSITMMQEPVFQIEPFHEPVFDCLPIP